MILDLDPPAERALGRGVPVLLPALGAVLGAALLLTYLAGMPARPRAASVPVPAGAGVLRLPPEARLVSHRLYSGVPGLAPLNDGETGRRFEYELPDGRRISLLELSYDAQLPYAAGAPPRTAMIHGTAALLLPPSAADRPSVVAWTEHEIHYQLSSRDVTVDELVRLANGAR